MTNFYLLAVDSDGASPSEVAAIIAAKFGASARVIRACSYGDLTRNWKAWTQPADVGRSAAQADLYVDPDADQRLVERYLE